MTHPIFTEEHDLIRSQLRRFVDEKVKPHGPTWEEAGFVPREVLREMGELGLFSLRVPEAMGGAGLDARASVVLAEDGRTTRGTGAHHDTLVASVRAYVNALNKLMVKRGKRAPDAVAS